MGTPTQTPTLDVITVHQAFPAIVAAATAHRVEAEASTSAVRFATAARLHAPASQSAADSVGGDAVDVVVFVGATTHHGTAVWVFAGEVE